MTVRQLIPEGLARMAPGPELGGLTMSALTGADLVEVLRARARQLSHEQAQLLAAMVEVGLCDPRAGTDEVARLTQAGEYAADEIRAALAWTRKPPTASITSPRRSWYGCPRSSPPWTPGRSAAARRGCSPSCAPR